MSDDFDRCLFLTGPTASGKSSVGLLIAEQIGGEIVSLDSMAIYRGMDIATAKPTVDQQQLIPHHLIDIVEPHQEFSLSQYVELARKKVQEIEQRGQRAIFVGGTALYLKSLLRGIFEGPQADWQFREQLQAEAEQFGPDALHDKLKKVDPVTAERLHPNDVRRVIRALEVYEKTSQPISELQQQFETGKTQEECDVFVLNRPRPMLHQRINQRVEQMFHDGLIKEVQRLLAHPNPLGRTARQALGYREVIQMFDGQHSQPVTIELIQQHTRQFAKRQMTWFRSLSECRMVEVSEDESPQSIAEQVIAQIL